MKPSTADNGVRSSCETMLIRSRLCCSLSRRRSFWSSSSRRLTSSERAIELKALTSARHLARSALVESHGEIAARHVGRRFRGAPQRRGDAARDPRAEEEHEQGRAGEADDADDHRRPRDRARVDRAALRAEVLGLENVEERRADLLRPALVLVARGLAARVRGRDLRDDDHRIDVVPDVAAEIGGGLVRAAQLDRVVDDEPVELRERAGQLPPSLVVCRQEPRVPREHVAAERRLDLDRQRLDAERRHRHVLRPRLALLRAAEREDCEECGGDDHTHHEGDDRRQQADSADQREASHRRRSTSERATDASSSTRNGLARKRSAPASSAAATSRGDCHADTTHTGTSRSSGSARISRSTSIPLRPGIATSSSIRSGGAARKRMRADVCVDRLLAGEGLAERDDDQLAQRVLVLDDQRARTAVE